jgi:hypothetical protein
MKSGGQLEALKSATPRRKLPVVRMLWPSIRVCLERGHTVREVWQALRGDGVEVNYKNLCACIADLRRQDVTAGTTTALPFTATTARVPAAREKAPAPPGIDPLANVRRLTEERRPGFHYLGTLAEKDLFGE